MATKYYDTVTCICVSLFGASFLRMDGKRFHVQVVGTPSEFQLGGVYDMSFKGKTPHKVEGYRADKGPLPL